MRKLKNNGILQFLFMFVALTFTATSFSGEPLKVFILAGQSNMLGQGELTSGTAGNLRALVNTDYDGTFEHLVDGAGVWAVRSDTWIYDQNGARGDLTVGFGSATTTIGPELEFGHVMGDFFGEQVLIIKTAWGGKSLGVDFRPPSSGWSVNPPVAAGDQGYYYQQMMNIVNDVLANLSTYFPAYDPADGYQIAGFGWHQGWNDRVSIPLSAEYQTNMANFINDVRSDLGVANLPFVIATTGMDGTSIYTDVELAQLEMANASSYPAFDGNVEVVDTRAAWNEVDFWREANISPTDEDYHWNRNAESYFRIGKALGEEIADLIDPSKRLDSIAPTPSPMTFAVAPTAISDTEITMTATTASDDTYDVEYYFTCTSGGGHDSGWHYSPVYTDTLLNPDTQYTYTVMARDRSVSLNETVVSSPASATTELEFVGTPRIYEPFDYPVGALNGQGGTSDFGLDGVWTANSTSLVDTNDLAYGMLPTTGRSIGGLAINQNRFGGARTVSASALAANGLLADGATLWFSLEMGYGVGANILNARLAFALANDRFSGGNGDYWIVDDGPQLGSGIGVVLYDKKTRASQFRDLASGDGAGGIISGSGSKVIEAGERRLVVGKIEWGATPADTDTITIYTPDVLLNVPGDPVSTLSVVLDQSTFDTITWARGDAVTMDEIRFGETFDNVVGDGTGDPSQIVSDLITAMGELKGHVEGTVTLSPAEIEVHKQLLDSYTGFIGYSESTITAAMDLVTSYDTVVGPLFVPGSPIASFTRVNMTDDDIDWAVYHVMQYIMDSVYNSYNIGLYETLLGGFEFGTADYFPGPADPPANPDLVYTAIVNASYPYSWGHEIIGRAAPARRPTGAYAAPGSVVTLTVPASIVGKGYKVRIGAHSSDFSNKPIIKRLDRSSLVYDVESTEVKVSSPLGGGIYIEVPYLADEGVINIDIKNAIRSAYFSSTSYRNISNTEWQNTERSHPAPWADFLSDKIHLNVPTDWIYAMDDPVTLMSDWDKACEACDDLMGYPAGHTKETFYEQVDLLIKAQAFSPGYPSVNNTYDPEIDYGGYADKYLVRGPQNAPYYQFHEQGHGYLFQKFPGETESNVNLLHVAVWNQKFGYSLDYSLAGSMSLQSNPYKTLDNTAVCWMMCENFKNNLPMAQKEKQYQLKGHAKFVDIARMFSWANLGNYWYSFNVDHENGITWANDIDSLLLRLSTSVGFDIRPLFEFWGVHPIDPNTLDAAVTAANLDETPLIYDTLVHYQSLVPADNAAYQAWATNWWEGQPSSSGYMTEADHASIWDTYDAAYASVVQSNVQAIIDRYYPGGRPFTETNPPTPDPMTFATAPYAEGQTSISMVAATASDPSGVEYYFTCIAGGGNDSGWQDSPAYTDTGLTPDTQYTYTVIARDKSGNFNTTVPSAAWSATTAPDTTAPNPNPMTWASVPAAVTAGNMLIYEPFDYPVGALNGQGGTSDLGLEGVWTANSTSLVDTNDLAYGLLPTTGRSIGGLTSSQNRFGGARTVSASALAANGLLADGATLWFSLEMGYGVGANILNSRLAFALANDQFNAGNYNFWIDDDGAQLGSGLGVTLGSFGDIGQIVATQFRDLASGDGTAGNVFGNYSSAILTAGGQHTLVVGKITWGAGSDTIEIYVPDTDLNLGSVISTLTVDVDQSVYDTITWCRGDKLIMDEIRFGSSSSEVLGQTGVLPSEITMTATQATDDTAGVEYYFTCTSGGGNDSGWQDSPVYTDTNLSPGTQYTYTVIARDKSANQNATAASTAESATTGGETSNQPPAFTTDPINEVGATEDTVYDSSIADNASDPESDLMTFSKVSGPAWLNIAADGTLSGTPTNGDVGANTFTVQVSDGNGGTDTAILEITVDAAPDTTPPAAPGGLSLLAGIGSVSLDWADNAEGDLADYTVYRSTTSGSGYSVIASSVAVSDYIDSSVINHTEYFYVVTATDTNSNESAQSSEASATPGWVSASASSDIAVQGSVSGTLADVANNNDVYQSITEVDNGTTSVLEHKWIFSVTGAELVTFYVEAHHSANTEGDDFVFAYSTNDVNYTDMVTVTKTTDNNTAQFYALPSGLNGTVYIRVLDADRTGGNLQLDRIDVDAIFITSEESTVAPAAATSPAPTDGATDIAVDVDLSWTAGLMSTSHDVYFGTTPTPGAGEFQGNQTGTTFDPGTLLNATTYYWAIDEANNSGTTTGSVWSFTTDSLPVNQPPSLSFVTPLNAQAFTAGVNLYVKVDASDSDGSVANINLYLDGQFVRQESIAPYEWGAAGQSDPLLENMAAGSYLLEAIATDDLGAQATNTISIIVDAAPPSPPAAPSGLSATAVAQTQIDLSWTDNSSDETGFRIERSRRVNTAFAEIAVVGQDVTSYNDTTVFKGTTYFYRVRATNADGDSVYSNETSAKTPKK